MHKELQYPMYTFLYILTNMASLVQDFRKHALRHFFSVLLMWPKWKILQWIIYLHILTNFFPLLIDCICHWGSIKICKDAKCICNASSWISFQQNGCTLQNQPHSLICRSTCILYLDAVGPLRSVNGAREVESCKIYFSEALMKRMLL